MKTIVTKNMNIFKLKLMLSATYIINACANTDNNFLFDYFVYKNVSNVVGFSCNVIAEDVSLLKRMNKMGIRGSLYKLNNASIVHFVQANYYKVGIFIDLRCDDRSLATVILSEASNYRFYDELRCWLLLGTNLKMITRIINDESFGISTDVVIAVASTAYALYDVYNPYKNGDGKLNVTFLGHWNYKQGFTFESLQSKILRRLNLRRMVIKTAFFGSKYKPQNVSLEDYLNSTEISTVDGFSRFGYSVLSHVSEMYNFTLNVTEIGKWEKNDTIGPMSRAINNNEIDISGNPVLISATRLSMAKFVYPSWPFRTCFIFRNPQPTTVKFEELFRPFDIEIWYFSAAILILIIFVFTITLNFESFDTMYIKCLNCFIVLFGAVCQQGTDLQMRQLSTRITFFFTMLFCFLVYNFYSSSIVSARLSQPIIKINDSLNELVKTGLQVSSEPLLYFDFFIKEDKWETKSFYIKRWLTTPEEQRFRHPNEGMQLVLKGTHAYHTHPDVAYTFVNRLFENHQICELTEVHLARLTYASMAVTYNSSLVELMKIGFARVSEFGIRHRMIKRLTAPKPRCRQDLLTASSIAFHEVGPHLYIILFGIILSGIICFTENFIYVFSKRFGSSKERLSAGKKFVIYLCKKN